MNTTSQAPVCKRAFRQLLFLFVPLAAFALALSVTGPARAGVFTDPMFSVNVTPDIVYGTGQIRYPDNLRDWDLKLDLYQPTGAGLPELLPGIVLIHGGSFEHGTRADMSDLATEFASRGYVTTSITYRLKSQLPPPAPYTTEGQDPLLTNVIYAAFEDAIKGVNWLRDSAGDLNVDTDRIIVGGASAGGVTSLFVGTAYNSSTSTVPPEGNSALIPGVEVAGILDIFGCLCRSGLSLVDPEDPPTYIIHGRQDETVIYEEATDLAAALTAAGVPVGFPLLDGDHGHMEEKLNTDLGDGHLVIDDMFEFFNEHLELQALVIPVPEPSSITLLAAVAVGGLTLRRRRSPVV